MLRILPYSPVENESTMIDKLATFAVLLPDFHELLEDRIVAMIPVFQFVEVRIQ